MPPQDSNAYTMPNQPASPVTPPEQPIQQMPNTPMQQEHKTRIEKWSQMPLVGLILLIISFVLGLLVARQSNTLSSFVPMSSFVVVAIFMFWILSRAEKLKNATFSSALFLSGIGGIPTYLLGLLIPPIGFLIGVFVSAFFVITVMSLIYRVKWWRAFVLDLIFGVIILIIDLILLFGLNALGVVHINTIFPTVPQSQAVPPLPPGY